MSAPICQNCRWHLKGGSRLNGERVKCIEMGNEGPTDDPFVCRSFYPVHNSCAIACAYHPPYHPNKRLEQEQELARQLKQPIRIYLSQDRFGIRDIEISPPWASPDDFDVSVGERPGLTTNTEGGIRLSCCGFDDYYCNVGAREAALFAWECALGAAIARSPDSFEEFWRNPEQFVKEFPNPEKYQVVIGEINV